MPGTLAICTKKYSKTLGSFKGRFNHRHSGICVMSTNLLTDATELKSCTRVAHRRTSIEFNSTEITN